MSIFERPPGDPERKELQPLLKLALELGPLLIFFAAYTKFGFMVATGTFMVAVLVALTASWLLTGRLAIMPLVTGIVVMVFGGLTLYFNDDTFFKMKPTIIYLLFGGILGWGLLQGRSYLHYVMEGMMPLTNEGWLILTRRLMFFFLSLAVLNELIWRTQTEEIWVYFKTFGLTAAIFLFFMTQTRLFRDHSTEEDEADSSSK